MEKTIRKLVRRLTNSTHMIIILIGLAGILVAVYNKDKLNNGYDIMLGISCSLIASAFAAIMMWIFVRDENEKWSELSYWGIKKIHGERSDIKISPDKLPQKRLDFVAFGLNHFKEAHVNTESIKTKIKNGLHVRILTLNPRSIYVSEQQKIENGGNINTEIESLAKWIKEINRNLSASGNIINGSIEIRSYDSIPLDFYCNADGAVYVGPYFPNNSSGKIITYEFEKNSRGAEYYEAIFEKIWTGNSSLKLLNSYEGYFLANQKKAVEAVLKYFCDLMTVEGNAAVIGVISIIKGEYRRTFYSYNKKHSECHNFYNKETGSIGELIKLYNPENVKKILFFSDYTNNMVFEYCCHLRNEYLQKSEHITKQGEDKDTVAILAAPLILNNEFIGVITFDFASLPLSYLAKVKELKEMEVGTALEGENYAILNEMFEIVNKCIDIIIHMLGQACETEYKKLYQEDW